MQLQVRYIPTEGALLVQLRRSNGSLVTGEILPIGEHPARLDLARRWLRDHDPDLAGLRHDLCDLCAALLLAEAEAMDLIIRPKLDGHTALDTCDWIASGALIAAMDRVGMRKGLQPPG
jgi:hypothetical protein